MLYLCNPLTQLNDRENDQPALPAGTPFRWISQPATEEWFPDSRGSFCWVFETIEAINGFESAPTVYPNGEALVDDNCTPDNDPMRQWEVAK